MIIKVHKFIVQTYGELFKEKAKKLGKDILLLSAVVLGMFFIDRLGQDRIITIFEVGYRVDILLFYLLGFLFIITSSVMFLELRNLLNIISNFVITRFPRMDGQFGPGKKILRDMVQIVILFLVFYPVAGLVSGISYRGFQASYILSMAFLLLSLLFIYDILTNIFLIVNEKAQKLTKLIRGLGKKETV